MEGGVSPPFSSLILSLLWEEDLQEMLQRSMPLDLQNAMTDGPSARRHSSGREQAYEEEYV